MADIRLRHLLHHTSGLADVTAPSRRVPASNADVFERLQRRRQPALDSPGRRCCYNNTGYVLLAEVVSRVFQRPIGPLAWERIFRPLAMTRTWLSAVAPIPTTEPSPPGTLGDGGLWTTVADLIGYLNALNCDLLDPAVVHRVETPGWLDDGTPLDYAWGVRVTASPAGRRIRGDLILAGALGEPTDRAVLVWRPTIARLLSASLPAILTFTMGWSPHGDPSLDCRHRGGSWTELLPGR